MRATPDGPAPLVWDLPLRLFHWALVLLLIGSFVSIKLGGNWVDWHFRCGYALLTLILFRLAWGLFGSRYARFSSFLYSPRQLLAYLRGAPDAPDGPGHSPLAALSVFAMLGLIGTQAVLGLFANDDIASEGPLAVYISKASSDFITGLHHRNEYLLLALIGLHLLALAYYRIMRGKRLAATMVHGRALQPGSFEPARDDPAMRTRALAIVLLIALCVYGLLLA